TDILVRTVSESGLEHYVMHTFICLLHPLILSFILFYSSLFSFILLYSFISRKYTEIFRTDQVFLENSEKNATRDWYPSPQGLSGAPKFEDVIGFVMP
ncbi:MAG: hypothetical protein K6B13_14170, partial [Prevotella sp.]|nr:hypothetical protein [Prevotella sp.]